MRLKQEKVFVIVSTMLLFIAIPFIIPDISPILTGPIEPNYDDDPNQEIIDSASDKYVLAPHIRYVGNNTDQFPTGENITYSAHAGIYVDGQHRETLDYLSTAFVLDCGFHTSGYYTPDEIEMMNVGFLCSLTYENESTKLWLWTWGGNLKMKDASVFWNGNELYAKHYNTVDDDGFSMSVYLMNNDPSGGGLVDNPDPIGLEETQQIQIFLSVCFVVIVVVIYKSITKRAKQQQVLTYKFRPINDFDVSEPLVREPTDEEIEEIRLENIRKESRLKTLEELIQNTTAIKSPQHVIENTELSIEEFVPEDEREELVFGVLCNLHEEAKEKVKHDAIEEDR